jgi:hypothetical protein
MNEMKQFSTALNLSDDQKQRMQEFLAGAYEKVQEYRRQNPNASQEDLLGRITENRVSIRQRLAGILTAEQLTKWDTEVQKIKDFLVIKTIAAAAAPR